MPSQLGKFEIEAATCKQRGNLRPQTSASSFFLIYRGPQNIPHFLLHAAAISPRAPLQARFY